MQPRSHAIDELKTGMPVPGLPSRLSVGTSQSSKKSSPIGDVRRPIFESGWPTVEPGRALLDQEGGHAGEAGSLSIVAKTRKRSLSGAFVTKVFEPLST